MSNDYTLTTTTASAYANECRAACALTLTCICHILNIIILILLILILLIILLLLLIIIVIIIVIVIIILISNIIILISIIIIIQEVSRVLTRGGYSVVISYGPPELRAYHFENVLAYKWNFTQSTFSKYWLCCVFLFMYSACGNVYALIIFKNVYLQK